MTYIEWMSKAFTSVEVLPQQIAFEIVRRVDMLAEFSELGARLRSRFHLVQQYRQIIVNRRYRVIYEFDSAEDRVYILTIQTCRQKLPSVRDLKRRETEDRPISPAR
jgi:mRNA-degrading endonuclease RelE of RelBE toxin-antitoxin system